MIYKATLSTRVGVVQTNIMDLSSTKPGQSSMVWLWHLRNRQGWRKAEVEGEAWIVSNRSGRIRKLNCRDFDFLTDHDLVLIDSIQLQSLSDWVRLGSLDSTDSDLSERIAYVSGLSSLGADGVVGAIWLELVGNGSSVCRNAQLPLLRGPAQYPWTMADCDTSGPG